MECYINHFVLYNIMQIYYICAINYIRYKSYIQKLSIEIENTIWYVENEQE